jgi:hypothetical protein
MPLRRPSPALRATPWSWWRIGPLDSALAGAIVLVCLGWGIPHVPLLLGKLVLLEPLAHLRTHTAQAAESLALTGRLDALPPVEPQASGRFRYGRDQGQMVAFGVKRDGQTAFALGMRLAVLEPGPAWHALPLCGQRPAPAGWRSPARPLATGLADTELPWVCSVRMQTPPGRGL